MLHLLEVMVIAAAVVTIVFLTLLALPKCSLRQMLMPFVAWGFVVLCAVYVISPLDIVPDVILPFGVADDFGALVAGVATAMATIRANRDKRSNRLHDPYFHN